MRHNKKINHLGRTYSHRAALLSNMAASLIRHKRIFTTVAKAKELRKYVEPLITKSKENTTHARRLVFAELHDKHAVTELFQEVAQKVGERAGGYTRIIKTGNRLGDNAETCFIELVDFNELMLREGKRAVAKTRRSRRGGGGAVAGAAPVAPAARAIQMPVAEAEVVEEAEVVDEAPAVEEDEVVDEVPAVEEAEVVAEAEVVDEAPAEEEEEVVAEAPAVEEAIAEEEAKEEE
ncbi:50S ribosomal protein L17 [Candidatus Symbiothrix dinenymphae]|nr:50S ribosomal protein L17 [Candidatus Symbiothrix dinenymphae]